MAWDTVMITILRPIINDAIEPYTYSDATLKSLLVTSAFYVVGDIDWSTDYTVDVVAETITPDPSTSNPIDYDFINACVLRAACLIDQATHRTAAESEGVEAYAGPARLRISGRTKATKDLIDVGSCAAYEDLKQQINFGTSMASKAIIVIGPYGDEYCLYEASCTSCGSFLQ